MRFLPRLGLSAALATAAFLGWRLLQTPAHSQGGKAWPPRPFCATGEVTWSFFQRVFLVGECPQDRKHPLRTVCGESPCCGALQLHVLSGVIDLRCGGENRCQAAGGNSQIFARTVKCCWEGRREQGQGDWRLLHFLPKKCIPPLQFLSFQGKVMMRFCRHCHSGAG